MAETAKSTILRGGEWLIRGTDFSEVFIPEDFDEEQRMISKTCSDFLEAEVYPKLDELDGMQNPDLMPGLLDKAGALGLIGIAVPEEFGGYGKDFSTSLLATEALGAGHSFSVAISAHTGIGILPILLYGTQDQKKKYIPKLSTGEWKACYCLTEPGSGSDANSGKTRAVPDKDKKHYIINGQKMITNGGFADIFIVFAKIEDDENLSAFIVEKSFGGIRLNPEEKKMGIKGSSTRQVFFEDCKVPAENLLSERENGFRIAVNILNLGRIKLAAATVGASKRVIGQSVQYAVQREQFGRPIAKYGAIRHKLAEQVIRTFSTESATYRAARNIEQVVQALKDDGMDPEQAELKGVEQYAIECAILKVHASETLDYVVDEGVQIFGGMGFSAEAPMERAYRDSRINRIFEGTNEINRMLAVDMLLKRAMKGELDLLGPATKVAAELTQIPDMAGKPDGVFEEATQSISNFKKAILLIAGAAVQKLMQELAKEQEIIMNLADILIDAYVAESVLLRVGKLCELRGETNCAEQIEILKVVMSDTSDSIWIKGKTAIHSFAEGDQQRMMLVGLKRFTKVNPLNTKESRRKIAAKLIESRTYCY
jgi:alkylation response protein AidB-like acyl-CoA dehydrogenase